MSRFMFTHRAPIEPPKPEVEFKTDRGSDGSAAVNLQTSNDNVAEDQPELKADDPTQEDSPQRDDSPESEDSGDYVGLESKPYIWKILDKQGDKKVLFAYKVLRFTCSGKMKRRLFLVTDFALYIVDPETDSLRRRIALAAVEKFCLSKLWDDFFAIIIPTEYDLLMASTRKTEIMIVLVDAMKNASDYDLEVSKCLSTMQLLN